MFADTFPPATVKRPPTHKSLPNSASVSTRAPGRIDVIPEPSAVQMLPFHLAMFLAGLPPAVVNLPPAYKSLPDTVIAYTAGEEPPLIPEPNGVQLLPFHFAMQLAGLPPAVVNMPPAYRSLPDAANANTLLFIPASSADQVLPFHLAM